MKSRDSSAINRYDFITAMRGIAALCVVLQHMYERKLSFFHDFTSLYFQFGVFAVSLFFLISGFIIPVSLSASGSLLSFWIKRIFRIYPLYIFSYVLACVLVYVGWHSVVRQGVLDFFVSMTMLNKFLGVPMVLGVYWTLGFEMIFYLTTSLIFFLELRLSRAAISLVFMFFCLLVSLFVNGGHAVLMYFSCLFFGGAINEYYNKVISARYFFVVFLFFWLFCLFRL